MCELCICIHSLLGNLDGGAWFRSSSGELRWSKIIISNKIKMCTISCVKVSSSQRSDYVYLERKGRLIWAGIQPVYKQAYILTVLSGKVPGCCVPSGSGRMRRGDIIWLISSGRRHGVATRSHMKFKNDPEFLYIHFNFYLFESFNGVEQSRWWVLALISFKSFLTESGNQSYTALCRERQALIQNHQYLKVSNSNHQQMNNRK